MELGLEVAAVCVSSCAARKVKLPEARPCHVRVGVGVRVGVRVRVVVRARVGVRVRVRVRVEVRVGVRVRG